MQAEKQNDRNQIQKAASGAEMANPEKESLSMMPPPLSIEASETIQRDPNPNAPNLMPQPNLTPPSGFPGLNPMMPGPGPAIPPWLSLYNQAADFITSPPSPGWGFAHSSGILPSLTLNGPMGPYGPPPIMGGTNAPTPVWGMGVMGGGIRHTWGEAGGPQASIMGGISLDSGHTNVFQDGSRQPAGDDTGPAAGVGASFTF